jgi:hypothetical protein
MTNPLFCDDKSRLVEYLYDEVSDRQRDEIAAHVRTCAACAADLDGLRAVRDDLLAWQPPEADLGFRIVREPMTAPRRWWQVPAWAPTALAAGLHLADGAAVANVQVEYGHGTVVVRTGWSQALPTQAAVQPSAPAPAVRTAAHATAVRSGMSEAEVRAALGDLERRLRSEIGMRPATTAASVAAPTTNERADLLQQVKALIDESERRQERELALRVTQVVQDVDSQRRADLVRIEQGFGQIEGLTGQEAARQQRMINYLMKTSLQK